ncbi:hypothetical protein BC828DRAFT_402404 [Blastocladiella britannica]|nr:hypothetical protein BC828DRAFT_402404 [Blastocladiella britannica]
MTTAFACGLLAGVALVASPLPTALLDALSHLAFGPDRRPPLAQKLLAALLTADQVQHPSSKGPATSSSSSSSSSSRPTGSSRPPHSPGHSPSPTHDLTSTDPAVVAAHLADSLAPLSRDGMYSIDHVSLSTRPASSGFMNVGFWWPLAWAREHLMSPSIGVDGRGRGRERGPVALADFFDAADPKVLPPPPPITDFDIACGNLVRVVAEFGPVAGKRVVDVGYGLGDSSLLLHREYGCTVYGFTKSEQQASLAAFRVANLGLDSHIRLHQGDATDLTGLMAALEPHPPIDAIVCIDSAYHYQTRADFFAAAYQLLHASSHLAPLPCTRSAASRRRSLSRAASTKGGSVGAHARRRLSLSAVPSSANVDILASSSSIPSAALDRAQVLDPLPLMHLRPESTPMGPVMLARGPVGSPSTSPSSTTTTFPSPPLSPSRALPVLVTADLLLPGTSRAGRVLAAIAGIPASNLGDVADYERALMAAGFTAVSIADITDAVFPDITRFLCSGTGGGKWAVAGWIWWAVWRIAGARVVVARGTVMSSPTTISGGEDRTSATWTH